MDIINCNGYELHKEAREALEQAERAGWHTACIVKMGGAKYPIVSLSLNDTLDMSVGVETIPTMVNQSLRYRLTENGPTSYIKICYNQPVISPEQALDIIRILKAGYLAETEAENA